MSMSEAFNPWWPVSIGIPRRPLGISERIDGPDVANQAIEVATGNKAL
jgi:hypothetical protein